MPASPNKGKYYGQKMGEEISSALVTRCGTMLGVYFVLDEIRSPDRLLEVCMCVGVLIGAGEFVVRMYNMSDDTTTISIWKFVRTQLFADVRYHLGVYGLKQARRFAEYASQFLSIVKRIVSGVRNARR